MNLSAIILTKNEEKNISECINSVGFCDEIIVIDDYSSDKTVKLARNYGAKVIKKSLNNDFAAQRNFALKKASGKWVLFLDADERISPRLKSETIKATKNPFIRLSGFYLKRRDIFLGEEIKHGEAGTIKLLRLGKKDTGRWLRKVHETWKIPGRKGVLANPIIHLPHRNLRQFFAEVNKFSSMHAQVNNSEGKKSTLAKIVFWPLGHFLKNWIYKRGFLDAERGFIIAATMSFHSFLAWAKLWFLQKRQYTKV